MAVGAERVLAATMPDDLTALPVSALLLRGLAPERLRLLVPLANRLWMLLLLLLLLLLVAVMVVVLLRILLLTMIQLLPQLLPRALLRRRGGEAVGVPLSPIIAPIRLLLLPRHELVHGGARGG